MGVELLRGQNHPLYQTRLEVCVGADVAVSAGVIVDGLEPGVRLVHPGAPAMPGVRVPERPSELQRITLDLDAPGLVPPGQGPPGEPAEGRPGAGAVPDGRRLTVLLVLPDRAGGPRCFGGLPVPRITVSGPDGTELAAFSLTGLSAESVVAAVEFYRRSGAWRIRAIGQGYSAGLSRMLDDYHLPAAARLADEVHTVIRAALVPPDPAVPGVAPGALPGPPRPVPGEPVAGDAPGWSMEERLYNQVGGMFEDLARCIAAYRSARSFAEARLEREIEVLLADPADRLGPRAEAARERAQARRDDLVDRARAHLDLDLSQLAAESRAIEDALTVPYACWASPVWHGYRPPLQSSLAVRLGDMHLPEVPELRIPMLARLPLRRGLWIDSGTDYGLEPGEDPETERQPARRRAAEVAAALAVRLLAAHPTGDLVVHLCDATGESADAFAPLARSGALREWPGPEQGSEGPEILETMTRRVDLVGMALRAGAPRDLPPDLDTAAHLVVISGFPEGFDDRALTRLRYLADEGPAARVHLMLVADRADARAYGPLLDPLWRSLARLTPLPDDHLADPWVGQSWTYEPSLPPEGSRVLDIVLGQIAQAGQAQGG